MYHVKSKLRTFLIVVFSSLCLVATTLGLVACGAKNLKIDVPERIEADLGTGTYVVPRYDVVNEAGVIMAGYTVRLKSATDPNGEAAEIAREASTIVTLSGAGEYTFVYTADSKKVPDATVIMDFADRTAPTISLASSLFPAFYIKGVTYSVPEYTLSGDYVASKCYQKVFYNSGEGDDVEVELDDGNYTVEHDAGKYTVLIHVEDAAGNCNDYRYTRSVYSPENYDPQTVIYFNEAFGEKQVAPDGDYAGKYVSVAEGGKAYGDEAGSYKIVFDGSETNNNEAYFALNVPAITNIMEYKELEMYVYIEDDDCAANAEKWGVGSKWWNDTPVKVGEWTRVTWSVENWGNGVGANSGATTSNVISTDNITGTRIRLTPDAMYPNADKGIYPPPPHGTVYFSAMRAVPYEMSQVTAGENVTLDKRDGSYRVGDTVTLTAKEIEGKTLDCFLVDGKPIGGNTFFAEKESYTVEAKYVDGKLTAENMTWGATEYVQPTDELSSWGVYKKLGSDSNWAVQYEMTATNGYTLSNGIANAWYVGVLYRNNQLVGYEMGDNVEYKQFLGSAGSGTGTTWERISDGNLPQALLDLLNGASQENPVTLTFIRQGNTLSAYISCGDNIYCVVRSKTHPAFDEQYGLDFGYGWRTDCGGIPTIQNIRWVAGEEKTNLYLGTLEITLNLTNVTAEKENYILGDTVTLTAEEAPAGQMFAYFTVDGEKVAGDTFVATKFNHTVAAVYAEISTLTLGDGVTTSNGNTQVGKGSTVTLVFNGTAPTGKYFVGFKVDGSEIEGNTFEATASAHTVEAVFADCIQTGSHQLNEVSKVQGADDYVKQHNLTNAEFVTDFAYSGEDGAVLRDGVLKVTVSGGEASVALKNAKVSSLQNYKSFYYYVYTVAVGTKSGGWWCNDTALTPGKWTKVEFTRAFAPQNTDEISVWEADSINEFYYRFMGGSDGTVFYVTAVYGVPYADVEVTVETSVQDYVTVSGTYKEGQTITLAVNGAPAGKKFAYFTINGERYDGTTYTLGTQNVTVGAVFTEVSTLTLGDGIATADGETEYAKGVTVTLSFDESNTPSGKLFNYFTVDGERIVGNTFEPSAATHTVAVVFADSAADLIYTTSEEAAGSDVTYSWSNNAYTFNGKAVGDATSWVIEAQAYDFTGLGSKWFSLDFLVGDNASLQIRLHSAGNVNIQAMGANHKDGTKLTDLDASILDLCKAATAENPVTFTAIRSGDTYYVLVNGELVLKTQFAFNVSGNKYGIGGTDCGTWLTDHPTVTYKYRTGEAVADYMTTVNVSGTKVTFDKANGVYKLGDTVTLTYDAAETGYAFAHYTIDGKTFSGDSFVAKKLSYNVVAVYAEVSVLTLGEGIATADGATEYARGVKVVLSFDPEKLNGKVVDYYVIDKDTENEIRVYNGEFTTSAATHTVTAVLVDPDEITWADGGTDYNYETVMGDAASEWKSRELDGEVYGSAEYWAVSVYVKHTSEWQSFEFIQGANQSIRVRFHNGGYCGIVLMTGKSTESIPSAEFTVAYPTKNEQVVNKLVAGATVTCVRNGDTISLYIDGYLFFTTNYAVDHTGNWFGVGHIDANDATKPEMRDTKYITGKDKVEAYLATLAASGKTQSSATQINTLNGASAKDGSVVEYITEGIPEGLNDGTVTESGVLKVTAASNDVGIDPGWTFDKDASAYEEIYFYVYMEDAQTNNKAGIYWAGDTDLTASTWIKISMTNFGNANEDLSKLVLRVFLGYSQDDPAIAGKTFYVTAVYGVPKTAE